MRPVNMNVQKLYKDLHRLFEVNNMVMFASVEHVVEQHTGESMDIEEDAQ